MKTIYQGEIDLEFFEKVYEHEQVVICNDPSTGLRAIIAIHDTTLGPATGGCRMWPYKSFDEALTDVLRLSKGMTYKCAAADVDFGGGKSVIIGDPRRDKSPELFRSFGKFVDSLNGRFYTGTDMGTTPDDFVHAAKETNCILGLPEEYGGNGDSSIPTSMGVMYGIKASGQVLWGSDQITGKTFAIQGLGKVGYKVAQALLNEGAQLYITDINEEAIQSLIDSNNEYKDSIKVVSSNEIYSVHADMFVPCALGGIINDETIEMLKVKAIVGSANNQLLEDRHGEVLQQKGILYAPDYIVNAGGLIQVTDELYGSNKERVMKKTQAIYYSLKEVYQHADNENISTSKAANIICERKIEARKNRNSFYTPHKPPKWKVKY